MHGSAYRIWAVFLAFWLTVIAPLSALHRHGESAVDSGGVELIPGSDTRTPDSKGCDICARLPLPVELNPFCTPETLREFDGILVQDNDFTISSHPFFRLKDRSPPFPV